MKRKKKAKRIWHAFVLRTGFEPVNRMLELEKAFE